jgi:hypothetical protein
MNTEMKEIIGQTITGIRVAVGVLHIETTCGTYVYETENDCCNRVWFSAVINLFTLGKVESVKVIDWNGIPDGQHMAENTEGHEENMGFRIYIEKCDKPIVIEVRNNHNGYYGGNVNFKGVIGK